MQEERATAQAHYLIRGSARDVETERRSTGELVSVRRARRLAPGRTRDGAIDELEVAADEIVRIELDNGFVLWSRADDMVREHGRQALSRDGTQAWEFDRLTPQRAQAGTARGERGLMGLGIKALEFFGVDLKETVASKLGAWIEDKQLTDYPPRLYRCALDDRFELRPLTAREPIPADKGPLLIFLHGTASSVEGSFGKLWADGNLEGKKTRDGLKARYGDRVFALQHRSLTESPIANALALLEQTPEGAELHLVSHSRGGLVGELLCLGDCENLEEALSAERIEKLFAADRTLAEQIGLSPLDKDASKARDQAYQDDRKRLAKLLDAFKARRTRVTRFVRVACPARGTTLASGRLDRWFSVLSFLTEKATGDGLFSDGLDFLLAVVKERTDPRTLPGLEAMMPGSALTRLLQHPDLVTRADLSVIAGDIEGDSLWGQIKLLATDWFYGADHDLVVNTGSMFGGLPRPEGSARFQRDQGSEVNHFNYFSNARSVRWLLAGLARADGDDSGFQPIRKAKHEEPRWRAAVLRSRAAAAPRPLAVVLPGIMGSAINVRGENVWLNYWAILRGELDRLRLDSDRVEATDLLGDFYGPLLEFLARSHRVEIFPYDWRLSVLEAARKLAAMLANWLPEAERAKQPTHIVAHSMGGLVVRAMIADNGVGAAVWRRILALPNSRFLMLGTPNLGSYEAMRWLTGRNPTEANLSLLDITHSTDEIIDIVRNFPGLLELLPFDADSPDFGEQAFWQNLKQEITARWNVADDKPLRQARKSWGLFKKAAPDPKRMIYVAGCQDMTVADYRLVDNPSPFPGAGKRLEYLGVRQGDGTVTWKSGLLDGVRTWYVDDTAHDELCKQNRAFPGYLDLLMTGATTLLPSAPPARARAAGVEPEKFVMPTVPPTDDIPDERATRSMGFGPGRPFAADGRPTAPVIQVGIRHGDLAYALHPVLVGHYQGDTIISAEQAMDGRLGGALSRRLRLGLYPGQPRTHALFFNEDRAGRPGGALVIGLGQVGELSPTLLQSGVRDAMLDFALQVARWPDDRFGSADSVRSAAVSCLLVGSGPGGVSIRDSVEAILRGAVEANERLEKAELTGKVVIKRVEFIELYEDMALIAAEALERLLVDGELAGAVNWEKRVVEEGQGRLHRPYGDDAPGWWRRLEIIEGKGGGLHFVASTDRARAEVTQTAGQLRLAEGFIQQASKSASRSAEVAKTLFEMLLPNRLKELAPRQTNLVLLVDDASARYPWELMEDRWSLNGRPPAVAAGLVRQLKTPRFRPRPAHASAATAFVVGNPDLGGWDVFPDLPGARQEAELVAGLLTAHGYRVQNCIDEKTDAILDGLHRDKWRILHLAGHGEHEFPLELEGADTAGVDSDEVARARNDAQRVSGMVIGKKIFLTPGDVEQMRWTPELVFINCCHLGKTQAAGHGRYAALAANLGVQFIEMGVKAVVAAGWAVDDDAASAFAESFYTSMLSGEPFGEAVRAAREQLWARFPNVNTWGAYQCYGDPGFRLFGDGAAPPRQKERSYHAPSELIADLHNHAERIRVQMRDARDGAKALRDMRDGVSRLSDRIPEGMREEWLRRGDVAAAIGFALGEAGAWADAVEWLEKAFASAKGDYPIRVVEQCANFKVRREAEQWVALRAEAPADLESRRHKYVRTIERAIRELNLLRQCAETKERLSLLGGAYKRLALVQTQPDGRHKALLKMAEFFRRAFDFDSRPEAYAFTNWATAYLLALRMRPTPAGATRSDLDVEAARVKEALAKRNETDPTFWNGAGVADIDLVRLIAVCQADAPAPAPRKGARRIGGQKTAAPQTDRAAECAALVDNVIEGYRRAIERGASPREIASVIENLDFVIEMIGKSPGPLMAALKRIGDAL